jgi:adenine nucleotide transporter 17
MKPKPAEAALFGCLGGLFATVCVYPLDLAKSKVVAHVKFAKKESISALSVLRTTLLEDGFHGLYQGFGGRAVQCFAEDFIFFW